ncbi:FUSC family protein [Sphingobacterium arenae]|uniref:FUSC family protein n=1 Tax=Sphingobacterium arenae TaxID=1280598 RepID=A0ABR7Y5X6_9SPHI|nr:FUSC family protein [Sphingobacterium arenae]
MEQIFSFNKSNRQWHLPFIAGLCVGTPMIIGWLIDNIEAGKLGSLAGLSILYIQSNNLEKRMILLMTCCFGIMISYTVGLLFSFSPVFAPLALGVLSFGIHYSLHKLKLNRPPGNFFFIMVASMAISTPFDWERIPEKIGYVALGTILTCGIGLIYSLLTLKPADNTEAEWPQKKPYINIVESLIFGLFVGLSLMIAFLLDFDNPYWIPISCLAVMQGQTTKHIWLRASQRVLGTLLGLGITWLIAFGNPTPLFMVIGITILQIIVEYLVVRKYAIAVVFITILTIFLAESHGVLSQNTNQVFFARLVDITIGSTIGALGGWVLFQERMHYKAAIHLRRARVWRRKSRNNNN